MRRKGATTAAGLAPGSAREAGNDHAEELRIWTAIAHLERARNDGDVVLSLSTRAELSPFVTAAVELALATVASPREDRTPLLETALTALDRANPVWPPLELALDELLPPDIAESWRRRIARNALLLAREYSSRVDTLPTPATQTLDDEPYSPTPAGSLEEPDASRLWLIEQLWQRCGTGIIGGGAKGAKTWLALDLALSVASGTPALDRFDVHRSGGVVYVSAEGGEAYVKQRLQALCLHRGLHLDSLPHPFNVIPRAIRIDTPEGLGRLKATIRALRPTLLVLDPIVRLHRIDENSAASVSGLLSNLTELQQAHDLAIILVHHATKQGVRSREMGGHDFRGSSDFYAWGDSNVFVKKRGPDRFLISAEHRAAPATEKWTLQATSDAHPRLQIVDDTADDRGEDSAAVDEQRVEREILSALHRGPLSIAEIRNAVTGSNARIGEAMSRLQAEKQIARTGRRWAALNGSGPRPIAS